jgi:hypothetical protein
MKKYPTYFIIWTLIHLYLLIQSIGVYHGSENFFFPFCISKNGIEYWPSLASYDLLEFLIYVVVPFSLLSIRKKKSKDEEKIKPDQEQTSEQPDSSVISTPDANKEVKIKWYDKSRNAILLSILFFPLGLFCLVKSKLLKRSIKMICLVLCIGNLVLFAKGIHEEYEAANENFVQAELQQKFDDFNDRKNLVLQDVCQTIDCIDEKISNISNLITNVNSIYYEAKNHDIYVDKDGIITELKNEIEALRNKKYLLINQERRTERLRRNQEAIQNSEKAHYDSLATLVYEAENTLDEQEYQLDHLRRFDAVPDLGIFFYLAFANLRAKENEIMQLPELAPRLKTIKIRMKELIQRTTYM